MSLLVIMFTRSGVKLSFDFVSLFIYRMIFSSILGGFSSNF